MQHLLVELTERLFDGATAQGFDQRLVAKHPIDTGPQSERARILATRLNTVRDGPPKNALVVWAPSYAAITKRGPWVYVSSGLAERLSDDALAFVIAHEMAHHDLLHFSPAMVSTTWLGHQARLESQADALGLRLMLAAGFDGKGALEALDPAAWGPEPVRPAWKPWREHPPMPERHQAIQALLRGVAA